MPKQSTKREARRKEKRERLLDNLRTGMSVEAACTQSSISRATYYLWIEEDEEFAEEVEAAKDFSEATLLQTIKYQGEAKQDWRASAWILERRFPDRWGAKREVDVNVNNTTNETDDIIISMIEQIAKPYQEITDDTADREEEED